MGDDARAWIQRHAAAGLGFVVALLAIWLFDDAHLRAPASTGDETCYLHAAHELAGGASPFAASCYVYPPLLAHVLALGLRLWGEADTLFALRLVNTAAAALTCAISARLAARHVLVVGLLSLALALAPSAAEVARFGNVSGLATGGALLGLALWPRHPRMAALALATAVLIKPLLPAALAIVLCSAADGQRAAAWRFALWTAALALLLALPGVPWLSAWLAQSKHLGGLTGNHNLALSHLLIVLGLPHASALLAGAVLLLGSWLAWRLRPDPEHALVLACAASIAASPVVWRHTLIMAYPCVAAAGAQLWRSRARASLGLLIVTALAITLTIVNDFFALNRQLVGFEAWFPAFLALACAPLVCAWVALRLHRLERASAAARG